jgi:hypothetical protein
MYAYGNPAPNPAITVGTGVGLLAGIAATGLAVWGASRLIEKQIEDRVLKPGPGGIPPEWLAEAGAVRDAGGTVGSAQLPVALPVALNVLGRDAEEGPNAQQFPFVTQPDAPLLISAKRESAEEPPMQVPLLYLFALPNGEVSFRVDQHALLESGVAFDVSAMVTYADGSQQGSFAQVNALVTNLTPDAAMQAWNMAGELVASRGFDLADPSGTRDEYIRTVLSALVPSFDWNKGPGDIGLDANFGSVLADLWRGVDLGSSVRRSRTTSERRTERTST